MKTFAEVFKAIMADSDQLIGNFKESHQELWLSEAWKEFIMANADYIIENILKQKYRPTVVCCGYLEAAFIAGYLCGQKQNQIDLKVDVG